MDRNRVPRQTCYLSVYLYLSKLLHPCPLRVGAELRDGRDGQGRERPPAADLAEAHALVPLPGALLHVIGEGHVRAAVGALTLLRRADALDADDRLRAAGAGGHHARHGIRVAAAAEVGREEVAGEQQLIVGVERAGGLWSTVSQSVPLS